LENRKTDEARMEKARGTRKERRKIEEKEKEKEEKRV